MSSICHHRHWKHNRSKQSRAHGCILFISRTLQGRVFLTRPHISAKHTIFWWELITPEAKTFPYRLLKKAILSTSSWSCLLLINPFYFLFLSTAHLHACCFSLHPMSQDSQTLFCRTHRPEFCSRRRWCGRRSLSQHHNRIQKKYFASPIHSHIEDFYLPWGLYSPSGQLMHRCKCDKMKTDWMEHLDESTNNTLQVKKKKKRMIIIL